MADQGDKKRPAGEISEEKVPYSDQIAKLYIENMELVEQSDTKKIHKKLTKTVEKLEGVRVWFDGPDGKAKLQETGNRFYSDLGGKFERGLNVKIDRAKSHASKLAKKLKVTPTVELIESICDEFSIALSTQEKSEVGAEPYDDASDQSDVEYNRY